MSLKAEVHSAEDLSLRPQRLQRADRDCESVLESRLEPSKAQAICSDFAADCRNCRGISGPTGKIGDDNE
jgi:hypothetical protein